MFTYHVYNYKMRFHFNNESNLMTDKKEEFIPEIDVNTSTVSDMFTKILNKKLEEGVLEKAIEQSVDKLMKDSVETVFRSYGDLGDKLKKIITAAITPNIENLSDFPKYHEMVMQRMRLAAQDFHDTKLKECLDKELKDIMEELPEKVTLSWLLNKLGESSLSDEFASELEMTLIIERSSSNYIYIAFDPESNVSKYSCKYRMQLSPFKRKEGEEAQEGDENKYVPFALHANGDEYHKNRATGVKLGTYYQMEKILFNIYAMGGCIEMDQGLDSADYETHFSNYD